MLGCDCSDICMLGCDCSDICMPECCLKVRDVKNKCAARGMVTITTSICVITTDFALSITKIIKIIKKRLIAFNLV